MKMFNKLCLYMFEYRKDFEDSIYWYDNPLLISYNNEVYLKLCCSGEDRDKVNKIAIKIPTSKDKLELFLNLFHKVAILKKKYYKKKNKALKKRCIFCFDEKLKKLRNKRPIKIIYSKELDSMRMYKDYK